MDNLALRLTMLFALSFVSFGAMSTENSYKINLYGTAVYEQEEASLTEGEPEWKKIIRGTEHVVGKGTNIKFADPVFCKSITATFFGNATHPGGARNGIYNEDNDGYGFKCNLDDGRTLSIFIYGILNSKYGNTLAVGISQGVTLIDVYGVRVSVGIALTALSYEMHRSHSVYYLVAPFPYAAIEFKLPQELGYIGFTRFSLSKGIYLRGAETFQINYKNLF